jgi:hypothetical protein
MYESRIPEILGLPVIYLMILPIIAVSEAPDVGREANAVLRDSKTDFVT